MGAQKIVRVNTFTGGLIGPSIPMVGPVADGGTIIAETAPGCWGPMITPSFKGGHEVTTPVAVEGAEPGDAILIRIKGIKVTSLATSSGVMSIVEGRYKGDPFVARYCPNCGTENPPTRLEGIGQEAVRCANCGAEVSPFRVLHGYTIVLDQEKSVALTVSPEIAESLAKEAAKVMALPKNSAQHPIVAFYPAHMPGVATRIRPFIGNIGTIPKKDIPDSHNAGDFGQLLVGAPHQYSLTKEELEDIRTDGHMDIDSVREGAILICPVKVPGGGIYLGDVHAMQGDGELAGHTTDVSAEVTLEVKVIKGLGNEGPILLPPVEDLPPLARPFSPAEKKLIMELAEKFGQKEVEEALPIQMVGSGPNLNEATENAISRLAKLFGLSKEEVMNRVTISGAVEIGRLPGVVTVTMLVPESKLAAIGLAEIVREHYGF
jgi:formamidase